ncbi:bifunctional heptose 7-phosphate kinase/heptose 1-phosphate adenyltransferase [Methanospirillum sp.]
MSSPESNILDNFKKVSVLIIGDIILDRYIFGSVTRISPEAPVPLLKVNSELFTLGGAAKSVKIVHKLAANVMISSVIGTDWPGQKILELFEKNRVSTSGVIQSKNRITTMKTRLVANEQQIVRFDNEIQDPIDNNLADMIVNYINDKINLIDVILIADYQKGIISQYLLEKIINFGVACKKPIIVYPKIDSSLNYSGVSVVIINSEWASIITGISSINNTSIRNMGYWLLSHIDCQQIIFVKRKSGLCIMSPDGEFSNVSIKKKKPNLSLGRIDTIASLISLCISTNITDLNEAAISISAIMNDEKNDFGLINCEEPFSHQ